MKRILQTLVLAAVAAHGVTANTASGAVDDDQVQKLIDRIDAQDRRITELSQALENAGSKNGPAAVEAAPKANWADRVKLKGDLRLRHENIDAEGKNNASRQRIRARTALVARLDDNLEVGFGLATGGGTPVSANYTLGDGFGKADVDVDLAYVDWNFADNLHLIGGRMKNPFHRPGDHGLVWDSDLRPEGASVRWDNGRLFAVGGVFTPARDSSGSSIYLAGAQVGGRMQLSDALLLTIGASYYDLDDLKGEPLLYTTGNSQGNTTLAGPGGGLVYATGYREAEAFIELATKAGSLPVSVFFDYVNNTAADDLDKGWAGGITLGDAGAKGSWAASYVYQDLEADAVVGIFTDSDFGGGGTNVKGHILGAAYALTERTGLAMTYFINKTNLNTGADRDYDRLQLDVNFKY